QQVRFLGRVPSTETNAYYQRAKVFVLPSANEGMSNALLEALASGLPAVVTDTGGSSELVTERVNGFIIARETEAIAKALEYLLTHEEERKLMGHASRTRAEAQSWQAVAEAYKKVYEEAIVQKV
ncbi:MAG: glycosyltransferase family 4 protein, partial [Patescibacteria group bacterium]